MCSVCDFFQSPPDDCIVEDLVGVELLGEGEDEEENVRVDRVTLRGRAVRMEIFSGDRGLS